MKLFDEDDLEADYYYEDSERSAVKEEPILYPNEEQLLKTIVQQESLFSSGEIDEDMRGLNEQEEIKALREITNHIYQSRLFKRGYFNFEVPFYNWRNDAWVFPALITDLGWDAYQCVSKDVYWNIVQSKPDYLASLDAYTEMLEQVSFTSAESVFKTIQGLRHSCYDRLRERIPAERERVWRNAVSSSSDPTSMLWDNLRFSQLDGLDRLKEERAELHARAYLRGIARADTTEHYLLQPSTVNAIPRDPAYDRVRSAVDKRIIEVWIARVQRITDPNDKLFARVEALSEDFHLVKAEAFLQKMKCWTPLDQNGRRT